MPDEDKTFSGSFVLDLRIWWRQAHTLYTNNSVSDKDDNNNTNNSDNNNSNNNDMFFLFY